MPRYHFNVHATGSHCSDGEGMVLRDEDAAIDRARQIAREIVSIDVREDGVVNLAQAIEIVADDGSVLRAIAFHDVVSVRRD